MTVVLALSIVCGSACKRQAAEGKAGSGKPEVTAVAPPTEPAATSPATQPTVRWFRARVFDKESQAVFLLGLPGDDNRQQPSHALVRNGSETVEIEATWKDGQWDLFFAEFESHVRARPAADNPKRLVGAWTPHSSYGQRAVDFDAEEIARPEIALLYPASSELGFDGPPAHDLSGDYDLKYAIFEGGIMRLEQDDGGVVVGTTFPDSQGDNSFLSGMIRGKQLRLSYFGGGMAYDFRFDFADREHGSGYYAFPGIFTGGIEATQIAHLTTEKLFDEISTTGLRPRKKTITLPALDAPRYAGKPVIVDITGTWCQVCRYSYPFLRTLKAAYPSIEILSLSFEMSEDPETDRRVVEKLKKAHGIDWEFVPISTTWEEAAKHVPPEIEWAGTYPVFVFVRRDRTIEAVHAGFNTPAREEMYEFTKQRLTEYAARIAATE